MLQYRRASDLLLSVGDLVNKGPDSPAVLALALREGMQAVRGNHDDAGEWLGIAWDTRGGGHSGTQKWHLDSAAALPAPAAYAAFRAWLAGHGIHKPLKHGWVAGLEESATACLADLPFSLHLPAYGVLLVHAGLIPGVPLQHQRLGDLMRMRDLVPACEAGAADAAERAMANGSDVAYLPTSGFDWAVAAQALLALQADAGAAPGGGDPATPPKPAAGGAECASQPSPPPPPLLEAREEPNPLGRAWAPLWPGPLHVFFGHDAKR